jgi:hypothetical protein
MLVESWRATLTIREGHESRRATCWGGLFAHRRADDGLEVRATIFDAFDSAHVKLRLATACATVSIDSNQASSTTVASRDEQSGQCHDTRDSYCDKGCDESLSAA